MPGQALSSSCSVQNYRCVVILGKATPITDPEEKAAALLKLTEHIIPGRTQHARAASDRELAQTSVLAIDLNEVSAKVSAPHCEVGHGTLIVRPLKPGLQFKGQIASASKGMVVSLSSCF